MFSVGETLKRARLEQGLDLSSVSARTRITISFLEAIESDDRKKLPSGFFYRSFVTQYAKALALDTGEIEAEIDRMLASDAPLPLPGQDGNPIHRVPAIKIRGRSSSSRVLASFGTLLVVIAGCSGVYAWWHDGGVAVPVHFSINVRFTPAKSPTVVEAAKPEASSSAIPVRTQSSSPLAGSTDTPVALQASESPDQKVLLDLTATEATWLSVSSDGKPVFSGILGRNETKTVEGKQYAKVRIGNAAGLDIRLNGKPLGSLGGRGQVLDVVFTPDNFEIIAPAKEGD